MDRQSAGNMAIFHWNMYIELIALLQQQPVALLTLLGLVNLILVLLNIFNAALDVGLDA